MIRVLIALFALSVLTPAAAHAQSSCPPAGYDRASLLALRADGLTFPNDRARNAFARSLTACVADPDPAIRDGVAYEAFYHFFSERLLTDATMRAVEADLRARLAAPEGPGFERPFAALVLSEAVRADVAQSYLTPDARTALLDASLTYLTQVRDYRGFDEREGWRHGVAHGADLIAQLSRHPAFDRAELERMRAAIAAQIAPAGHFYTYGEPERLAIPILFIARRGVFSDAEWSAWLAEVTSPAPLESWDVAFRSQEGLARRHDVRSFVMALYAQARINANAEDDVLLLGIEAALRTMP